MRSHLEQQQSASPERPTPTRSSEKVAAWVDATHLAELRGPFINHHLHHLAGGMVCQDCFVKGFRLGAFRRLTGGNECEWFMARQTREHFKSRRTVPSSKTLGSPPIPTISDRAFSDHSRFVGKPAESPLCSTVALQAITGYKV